MILALQGSAEGGWAGRTDWGGVGLILVIVGSFLLSNAILFRHPTRLVEEYFGTRIRRLHSIREYIFNRVQVHLGFLFLLVGFGLLLYGHYQPQSPGPPEFPVAWVGLILVLAVALEGLGWWWSQRLFRTYVRAFLTANPPDFETDTKLAREVGELFGVGSTAEDTVQSYVSRLRSVLGLPAGARAVPGTRPEPLADPDEI